MFVKGKRYRVKTLEEIKSTEGVQEINGYYYHPDGDCVNPTMQEALGKELNIFTFPMERNKTRIQYLGYNFDFWMFTEVSTSAKKLSMLSKLNSLKDSY